MRASSLVAAVAVNDAKFNRGKTLVAHSVGDWLNGGAKRRLTDLLEAYSKGAYSRNSLREEAVAFYSSAPNASRTFPTRTPFLPYPELTNSIPPTTTAPGPF